MSSTLPQGINTPTAIQPTDDVYSKMLKSAVEAAIEDIILVDESQSTSEECTCGQCGAADMELVDDSGPARSLAGAPMLYIEARANSAPLVLDQYTIAADIERIAPRWVQQPVIESNDVEICMAPEADAMLSNDIVASLSPQNFDPFDPGIDPDADLSLRDLILSMGS